jgi:hypothetical protein
LLCQLEPYRPTGFLLSYRCPIYGKSTGCDVLDFEGDDVAAPQLAVDGEIEHCEVTRAPANLKLGAD